MKCTFGLLLEVFNQNGNLMKSSGGGSQGVPEGGGSSLQP